MKKAIQNFIYKICKKALEDTDYDHEAVILRNTRHLAILILELNQGKLSQETEKWLTSMSVRYRGYDDSK